MGDSITEGTIVDLPVAVGDIVAADDVVVVLETDKVSVDVRTPKGGQITQLLGEMDDVVEVGSPLFTLDTDKAGEEVTSKEETTPEPAATEAETAPTVAAPTESAAPPPTAKPAPKPTPPPPPLGFPSV